jgi:hypothetical protein
MSEYLYIYRNPAGWPDASPQQMQQIMQKWMAWMKELGEKGHIKNVGNPLETTGKVVKSRQAIVDGPFAEAKDVVSGYTLVEAKDITQAAQLATGCPVFENGGSVEVRPIRSM